MQRVSSDRRCSQCQSLLVRSSARGVRETLAFVLNGEIRRCLFCEARFICFGRFAVLSRTRSYDLNFTLVWLALVGGVLTCAGVALWTLRRFHRWPF